MKASALRMMFVLAVFILAFMPAVQAAELNEELSDSDKGAIGCAVMTGITVVGSFAAGPGELIMIAGGGSLAPSATAPLMVSLAATAYVAACGIGIAATPVALWFYEQVGVFFDGLWGKGRASALDRRQEGSSILAANSEVPNSTVSTLTVQPSR
jgi:hypothetical protein